MPDTGSRVVTPLDDEKISIMIKELKNKAYIDDSTGLPNIVSLKEKLGKLIDNGIKYLLFVFEIDGAEELENFLPVKSYRAVLTSISEKLRKSWEDSIQLYALSDKELAIIYDNGINEISEDYINSKIAGLKNILNEPVSADDIELSFTSSGGVYRSDEEHDRDEIIHNVKIAKTYSQKVGGGDFTVYSTEIREKYNSMTRALVDKHIHAGKKNRNVSMLADDVDNFETKVFFLYPQSIIQSEFIQNIVRNEYSAFVINDHMKLLQLLKKYTNSIVFINIDSVLTEPEWEKYIQGILDNPEYQGIRVGVLSYKDDNGRAEKYLMKLMVPCGFIILKSGLNNSLGVILKVLEANEAKGKRKYVRVKTDGGAKAHIDAIINKVPYHAEIFDLSSIGVSAAFKEDTVFRDSTDIERMDICLDGVRFHTTGRIMGTRLQNGRKLHVIVFDKNIEPDDVGKIYAYIYKTKQGQLDEEIRSLRDDA